MFRLEEAIGNWKQAVIVDGAISEQESLELESHLRESILTLQSHSLSEQEAFLVASNRFGQPAELQQEFEKNNPVSRWRYRLFWMLVGAFALKAVGSTASAISGVVGTAMAASGFAGSVSAFAMIVATALLWVGVLAFAFRRRKRLGLRGESLSRVWIAILAIMLVVAPLVSLAARLGQARLVAPSWFGDAAIYANIGGYSLNLCVGLFCFAVMWKLNDRATLTTD